MGKIQTPVDHLTTPDLTKPAAGPWTADKVRESLPTIDVKCGCRTFEGRISGRALEYPQVTIDVPCPFCPREGQLTPCHHKFRITEEFSWGGLAILLNSNGACDFNYQ
jgi:hypothetical protein